MSSCLRPFRFWANDDMYSGDYGGVGVLGQVTQAGVMGNDAPYFVDGRRDLKDNLRFLIQGASLYQPFGVQITQELNEFATNFEEFGFIFHTYDAPGYEGSLMTLNNLWPFTENFTFANDVINTARTNDPFGTTNFSFTPNFAVAVPAASQLTSTGSAAIFQPSFDPAIDPIAINNTTNWGVTIGDGQHEATLGAGLHNLYGLAYGTGYEIDSRFFLDPDTALPYSAWWNPVVYQPFSPGATVTVEQATNGFYIGGYASQCPGLGLQLTNYYFAPLLNPGANPMALPAFDQQPFPLPVDDSFNVTNQTPRLLVGTVGQPMVMGGWAKYAILNSGTPTGKYAYLGQYFATNAFLLNGSGVATTNTGGVLSPYGEFFPTRAGQAALVTMPDIDTGNQATSVVAIVSLNVDANHDGVMDFTYAGPDQNSSSRPFRFWVNDDQDLGDYGGDGIPGLGYPMADGQNPSGYDSYNQPRYTIHGTRDLVDFFPVYFNIGSLFQSNALSAGISYTDTNWQFVLSQGDGALRFAYTDLTPTNYMNYLRDTVTASNLADISPMDLIYNPQNVPFLTTVSSTGVALSSSFVADIATNSGGIILVEAWKPTTQPLVLTVYHGTNQMAQTQLYLSISGVEQMFRSKSILLYPDSRSVPDRLTDAQVPNEPDTTDVNFIFVHGYNVNPDQARGWDADVYKRLYWSGSHAKFYGVTWTGSDSQVGGSVSINLQTNIVHAFNTAPLLDGFLNSLSGTNVVAAHSLGNVVVLDTLNDYSNQNINTYCMIDGAVAIEAIDPGAPLNPDMYSSGWTNYESHLWAADWHNLFPANDARSELTWSGRLANLRNANVYNFYSSGEEVLRDFPGDPPTNYLYIAASQLAALWKGDSGVDAWAFQEKLKGLMLGNGFLSSDHGGWQMNEAYETNVTGYASSYWQPMSPGAASELTTNQLQTNAFFNVSSAPLYASPFTNDLALESSGGSSYAQANRNRILSDAIPCLTLPLGANYDTNLDTEFGGTRNFDTELSYENGWPAGRPPRQVGAPVVGEWHHSDVRAVAYTFTYQLFNQIVTIGSLK